MLALRTMRIFAAKMPSYLVGLTLVLHIPTNPRCTQLTGNRSAPFSTHHQGELYQPIIAILYTGRTGTVASVIQADTV